MSARDFSRDEAAALVGRRIRTQTPWSGVPAGTAGRVVRMDAYPGERYDVAIQWELPERNRPLVDWFSRDEYERFLVEISEGVA